VAAKVNAVIAGSEVDRAFAPLRGITGVSKNTVSKLAVDADKACAAYQADKACAAYQADKACAAYQDRVLRYLPCKRVQLGEVWNFVTPRKPISRPLGLRRMTLAIFILSVAVIRLRHRLC
jgi:hypothetical protein